MVDQLSVQLDIVQEQNWKSPFCCLNTALYNTVYVTDATVYTALTTAAFPSEGNTLGQLGPNKLNTIPRVGL